MIRRRSQKEELDSPASRSTSSTRSLTGVGLTDGSDLKSVHSDLGVVDLEFRVSSIHDVEYSIDCEGGGEKRISGREPNEATKNESTHQSTKSQRCSWQR